MSQSQLIQGPLTGGSSIRTGPGGAGGEKNVKGAHCSQRLPSEFGKQVHSPVVLLQLAVPTGLQGHGSQLASVGDSKKFSSHRSHVGPSTDGLQRHSPPVPHEAVPSLVQMHG